LCSFYDSLKLELSTLYNSGASPLISDLSSGHREVCDGQSGRATGFSVLNDVKFYKLPLTVIKPTPFSLCELTARTTNG